MKKSNKLGKVENINSVEIICIGTELLLGNILNRNACWLAKELAKLGIPHYRQTVIGDNFNRLKELLIESSRRSKIIITTGGLGPTKDDLTTETIAAAFNKSLEERGEVWVDIKTKFSQRNLVPSKINKKQALLPVGAEIIKNKTGTAPGMIFKPHSDLTILTFPGVPSELHEMWANSAVPWFINNQKVKGTFFSKTLLFSGISESSLAEQTADLLNNKNPTVAPYASIGNVKLRITANAKDITHAKQIIAPVEKELRKRAGLKCFGEGEDSLASVVIDLLKDREETLSVAESCTGGGIGAKITTIPGASDVFLGGIIAYNNEIKTNILGVDSNLIEDFGAVSKQVVEAMAIKVREKMQTNWSIAISGIAGPNGGTPEKPVGLVHFCIAGPLGLKSSFENFNSYQSRESIQQLSVLKTLDQLRLLLLANS